MALVHLGMLTRARHSVQTGTENILIEGRELRGSVSVENELSGSIHLDLLRGSVERAYEVVFRLDIPALSGDVAGDGTTAITVPYTCVGEAEVLTLTRGNSTELKFLLLSGCTPVSDLATATRIVFAVKRRKTDPRADAIIFIEWLSGVPDPRVTIDDPSTGYVKFTLNSSDTEVNVGTYLYAVQVEWGTDRKLEWKFDDGKLVIEQDMIV